MHRSNGGSPWRDAGAGAGALAALVLLLVGVPLGLWAMAGWPLPSSLPSWDELADALGTAHVPDTVLTKALALTCWLIWLELVASVVVEAVALLRGRRAAPVPLAGPIQKMAGRLVAAVALLTILGAARGQAPEPAPPPLVVGAPVVVDFGAAEPAVAQEAAPGLPTYTVQHRDTLWDIAERHLGDPFRWGEIWELNQGRPQPDGASFRDPDLICPGWELSLPADATGLGSPTIEPASLELLVPIEDDGQDVLLAGSTDQELLVPLDGPADAHHAR